MRTGAIPTSNKGSLFGFSGCLSSIKLRLVELLGSKKIRYLDFTILVKTNKDVVALTDERHGYTDDDEKRLRSLLANVRSEAQNKVFKEAVLSKASLLVFGIGSGQHFHEGNKRTALVAGSAFLTINGFDLDMKHPDLVSVIDRVSIGLATLKDVCRVVKRLVSDVEK